MATKKTPKFDYKSIKTFEDACVKTQTDASKLLESIAIFGKHSQAIIAVFKLFIIFEAINNGWEPNWDDSDEYKWWPYFNLSSGFGMASGSDYFYSGTTCGSRLCTDTDEKAEYIAEQFQQEYKEFLLYSEK